jgi:7,8-dihydropterin-6-yl-methyl-4-(beta-D-ribofuranosyl)aminobenzene 5'-phosphate synthase
MECRITTLADNTAGAPQTFAEWGFSALIEADGKSILMDTGRGHAIIHNAELLDVDLKKTDVIVLSHGHADHTGGLQRILQSIRKEVPVIGAPEIWGQKYSTRGTTTPKYIGIPYQRAELESLGARFNLSKKPSKLSKNVMTTGEVPVVTDFEKVGGDTLLVKVDDDFQLDQFPDDRALIVTTELGLVVILGCAHRCLINTLYHAQNLTGIKRIHTVVGGCHLMDASEERIIKTIAALKDLDVQNVGVSHCTGLKAGAMMAGELGSRFFFNTAGSVVTVP